MLQMMESWKVATDLMGEMEWNLVGSSENNHPFRTQTAWYIFSAMVAGYFGSNKKKNIDLALTTFLFTNPSVCLENWVACCWCLQGYHKEGSVYSAILSSKCFIFLSLRVVLKMMMSRTHIKFSLIWWDTKHVFILSKGKTQSSYTAMALYVGVPIFIVCACVVVGGKPSRNQFFVTNYIVLIFWSLHFSVRRLLFLLFIIWVCLTVP